MNFTNAQLSKIYYPIFGLTSLIFNKIDNEECNETLLSKTMQRTVANLKIIQDVLNIRKNCFIKKQVH